MAEKQDYNQFLDTKKVLNLQMTHPETDKVEKMELLLFLILKRKQMEHLFTPISFIIHELISNANKANMCRVFFRLNGISPEKPKDYASGMKKFEFVYQEDPDSLLKYVEQYGMFLKASFQEYGDNCFHFSVANNAPVAKENIIVTEDNLSELDFKKNQMQKIMDKIKQFEKVKHDFDKFNELVASEENEGLGLLFALKLLDNIGIPSNSLAYDFDEFMTIAKLKFNYNEVSPPAYSVLAEAILKEVEVLPQFAENINALISKLSQGEVDINEVAEDIERDPGLAGDMLKLVNSAKFMLNRKIASIKESINYVGIQGLKDLLYSYGAMKVLNDKYGEIQEIWEHSHKTAIIAAKLVHIKNLATKADEYYAAGLLHDIGKIIVLGLDKDMAGKISDFCASRQVEMPIMEDIMMGLSHAKIGGKIAEHWGFPPSLISAIKYHHEPAIPDDYKELNYTIYLSNYFANLKPGNYGLLSDIDIRIKSFFNIKDQNQLELLIKKLDAY